MKRLAFLLCCLCLVLSACTEYAADEPRVRDENTKRTVQAFGNALKNWSEFDQQERFHRDELAQREAEMFNRTYMQGRQPYPDSWQERRARQEYYDHAYGN